LIGNQLSESKVISETKFKKDNHIRNFSKKLFLLKFGTKDENLNDFSKI